MLLINLNIYLRLLEFLIIIFFFFSSENFFYILILRSLFYDVKINFKMLVILF